jgi:hypothetical protein
MTARMAFETDFNDFSAGMVDPHVEVW